MKKFEVENHHASWLPDGDWKLAFADEFDAPELNRDVWDYRLSMMGHRFPAWVADGVTMDGHSHAVFTVIQDENGNPVSAQLQTGYNFMDEPIKRTTFGKDILQWNIGKLRKSKYLHAYGYYECRCKVPQTNGWWPAFWIQSPVIGASLDPADTGGEIDIMECFQQDTLQSHYVITGGYGQDCTSEHVGGGTFDHRVFHRFGLLWDETGYTFYVDGVEDGKIEKFQTARPEFILLTTEVKGYRRNEERLPEPAAFDSIGDQFIVDYVRVFDKV